MSFPLFINEDGSVGKEFNFGRLSVKVNDATLVDKFGSFIDALNEREQLFHNRILFVFKAKAYRPNDGWVNRKDCEVTFFPHEKYPGSYWFQEKLKPGDKIFIGMRECGGRFAEITEVVKDKGILGSTYRYKPLEETLNGKYSNGHITMFRTKNNYKPTFWEKLFGPRRLLQTDIYNED